jgi:hypothetical protein
MARSRHRLYAPLSEFGESALSMTATNTGSVPVTITTARFRIRGEEGTLAPIDWVMQTPGSLPIVLTPGGHWNGLADAGSLRAALVRQCGQRSGWQLQPVVSDSANREFRCPTWLDV